MGGGDLAGGEWGGEPEEARVRHPYPSAVDGEEVRRGRAPV